MPARDSSSLPADETSDRDWQVVEHEAQNHWATAQTRAGQKVTESISAAVHLDDGLIGDVWL